MDIEAILQFSNEETRRVAFDHYFKTLEAAPSDQIHLDALRLCVRLLSSRENTSPYEQIETFFLSRIPRKLEDVECHYLLAEICLSNPELAHRVFSSILKYIAANISPIEQHSSSGSDFLDETNLHNIVAYLHFLKTSFWLPSDQLHYITPELLKILVACIGIDNLDEAAQDTLSAFLHLLAKPSVYIINQEKVIDNSLFVRYQELPIEYFINTGGKSFRLWFQWVTHATANNIQLEAIQLPFYWSTLRTGLLTGFAEQRRYCLGIMHQSIILSDVDIDTPHMNLEVRNKTAISAQYDKFSTLYETVVLDRYANQVQACLPEMTKLFGPQSMIAPSWTTALLSAALSSKVQDGIRKLIGNWYLGYINNDSNSVVADTDFFVEGFLPWATQGNLFTTSLTSSRVTTQCSHGTSLSNALTKLVLAVPQDSDLLSSILLYILDTGGKIFPPAVLYLIEGILNGLAMRPMILNVANANLILRLSRLPSLPEVTSDLLTVYCDQLGNYVDPELLHSQSVPSYDFLRSRIAGLKIDAPMVRNDNINESVDLPQPGPELSLPAFLDRLNASNHKMIQYEAFEPACKELVAILDQGSSDLVLTEHVVEALDALWEEADRLEYPRSTVVHMPPLFFHPTCIKLCVKSYLDTEHPSPLVVLLSKVLNYMQRFTEGRSYLLDTLGTSIRKACFLEPRIMSILPIEDFLVKFINNPPVPKKEFLFEAVFAQKLEKFIPYRNYEFYYCRREWHGYAAIIDLISRFPNTQVDVARRILDRILEPWKSQQPPIPIISKWKNVFQLQAMLLLLESCVDVSNMDTYLDAFMHALVSEQWPRYRFLLEWIITRIYYRGPDKVERILKDLAKLDENSPVHVASLMKLALLTAQFINSEDFTLRLVIQLIPFSASSKIQIRHEAQWTFPTVFGLAKERGWSSITQNPGFQALDKYIRNLEKFTTLPLTIRTFPLDAVKDFNLKTIFQGRYMSIETPELERVGQEDFQILYAEDQTRLLGVDIPESRVPLGAPLPQSMHSNPPQPSPPENMPTPTDPEPNTTFYQTKANFDIAALLPTQGPPSAQRVRPASVILIASLIDNPTNLGGLSRISESFGLEALYIDDVRKTTHKDFKATSVTSEKHFPIHELKELDIPAFLTELKRKGYEVVGIEQTDRSGMLGEGEKEEGEVEGKTGKVVGTLPRKCVLVLGSERGGITKEVLAAVDRCVEIRTVGVTRSLNVQTAGGIAVYEWWREWGGKV
ncbi:hypothetical protein DM02DRAFT_586503 [Periconia macrospinosa]|uniref:tRNA/rRNA methyltransferase SpoU type domain-containing protein n=1 Tax=Periconia macrospinosa TaxID=97972 RepID=A0A2V1E145_9PLEO|nr:hypothetical protein DM02DRAFT_586503 [Periconia macrospinosa]